MKTKIFNLFTLITLITITSCGDKAKEAETKKAVEVAVTKSNAVAYVMDANTSTIEWKGFKPTGTHNGTIAIKTGKLSVNKGAIEAGKFIIDMDSIIVNDIPVEEEGNAKLTNHLKSADFFDAQAYPEATFIVTGMDTTGEKTMLSGNLTLKKITNNVSFPVKIAFDEDKDTMTMTSETFSIDRSKWDVKHGSKSFFDDLGDKFINDEIELKIAIKASKF